MCGWVGWAGERQNKSKHVYVDRSPTEPQPKLLKKKFFVNKILAVVNYQ